ncbi:hypothetical protein PQG46_03505 [Aquirufa nivalisilvae]
MNKSQWYRHLFSRIDKSIELGYYFESAFIAYGIIEDRLTSIMEQLSLQNRIGVANKIKAISKVQSQNLEFTFGFKNWDGKKYKDLGLFGEVLAWGELYRNPIQHLLGDPKKYIAQYGGFHIDNTKDLAVEGKNVSRNLSAAVMRYKKLK